ncbi:hypothetical protein GCM10027399_14030 [Curvibacter fontanus]|uniref:hypothetical protein n=1 Tax=Hydrogenophaga sp. TaxID=1904254 RepID=UPI00271936DA|nr:hypothetical protein [Hydrogenophaga sp.]MDO9220952.1 hypothetical protein [Thiobacillus sp.]MDZ4104488.1 hypothetical protein [Hydrogenophaga sp.]
MTKTRTHSFAWRDFAANGVALTEAVLEARTREFKEELCTDLPSLRSLMASSLGFEFMPGDNTMQVIAHLLETPQRALRLSVRKDGSDDLFNQDIARILEDQARLRESYAWAFSCAINPASDARIAELRNRARRHARNGQLHIHSGQNGELFATGPRVKTLPLCKPQTVKVRVLAISRTWADVQLQEDLFGDDQISPAYQAFEKIRVYRDRYSGDAATTEPIAEAMDSLTDIDLRVVTEHRWTDGMPYRVTLIDSP